MPGVHHTLKSNYSIETNEGFARLSRMAGKDHEWPPPNTGNVNEEIMTDAVYGGAVDPNAPQEYAVYSVDWLEEQDELPEGLEETSAQQAEEADVPAQGEQVAGRPVEDFTRRLGEMFGGWIYHRDRGEVYVLKKDED